MKIVEVNKQSPSYSALLAFVEKHKVLFNSPQWVNNFNPTQFVQCAILNNNNEVIGCFVYYIFTKAGFRFAISAPYTPHIDLYFINPSESVVGKNSFNKEISEALAIYFDSIGCAYKNLNLPDYFTDTQPFTWRGYTARGRYSYVINLRQDEEQLWNNLSSEKRKSINKAQKDQLVISETHDYELVYSLIIKSLSRNNLAKNTGIIRNILFKFATAQNSFAFVAHHQGVPIGATYCVVYNNTAMYLFGGFDAQNKHHGAGVSCMWQSILTAKARGLSHFDFEGSMNESIERYFREFGGQLVPYFCVEKIKPLLKTLLSLKGQLPA